MITFDTAHSLRSRYPNLDVVISCGNGWLPLCEAVLSFVTEHSASDQFALTRVRLYEKYGTLRADVTPSNDAIEGFVLAIEDKSEKVCESCGNEGRLIERDPFFVRVRCFTCEHNK